MIQYRTAVHIASLAGLSLAAVSAHALTIDFVTVGTTAISNSNLVSTETIVYEVTNPVAPTLKTYSSTINLAGALPDPGTAVASDGGANSLDLTLRMTNFVQHGRFVSGDGTWTYGGGTGAYGGFASGGGTFAFSNDFATLQQPYPSYTSVVGQLNPVPEPASLAVVGLGLVGLVARRRRS